MNDSEIEQKTGGDIHFVIGITVSGIFDGEYVTPHVVAAIAELESSRDFRNGTLPDGYVFEHKTDFDRITVTTQINHGRRPVLTEGDAQADLDGTPRPDYYTD
jgi:hypothetical protein